MFRPVRWARRRPVAAVLALTALALSLRLVGLGVRTMHWDEARVAYWTLRHVRGAALAYRPEIHGPLVPLLVAPLFERFGPSAVVARLPIALLGGLAPLAALLFRQSGDARGLLLDDDETIVLAGLLAVVPALVYYSRFMRSDVPLAVFALVALGFAVRAVATGRRRHVVAAGLFTGLAVPTKENVLLYGACALGAAAVAVCWPAVVVGWRQQSTLRAASTLRESLGHARKIARRQLPAVPAAALAALVPVVFFLAPRGVAGDPTLGAALAGDSTWLALIEHATVGTWETFASSHWTGAREHGYLAYAARLWGYLLVGALPAVVGAGYAVARERTRPLVVPLAAWGVAAALGYPLATDIPAPWIALHMALPLLPVAGIGWVALARERPWRAASTDAGARRRYARYALAALVVLSAVHVPLVIGASSVTPPLRANVLAQSAQPADDLGPMRSAVDAAAADGGGVLFYGDEYYLPNETVDDEPPAPGADWLGWWLDRLPMAWYVERANASSAYARDPAALRERESLPPVVVANASAAAEAGPILTERGYERTRYDLGLYHEQAVVAFVDESRLDGRSTAPLNHS